MAMCVNTEWRNVNDTRNLLDIDHSVCDKGTKDNTQYDKYFTAMKNIYKKSEDETCLPVHRSCGWPKVESSLPLFVFSIGLEGAGHHLWTELFDKPVFDCVWKNARHYHRDIADGVPRQSAETLKSGFKEQFQLRRDNNLPPCKSIYDAEDSFPTGAIRKSGRIFMRPDLINLQKLDGKIFNIKYIIILRNVTDTALSALRRNFFYTVDEELRTVEHILTYLEAAIRSIPCHKIFIAHYEHVLADPNAYVTPLSDFLQLGPKGKQVLSSRLTGRPEKEKLPARKKHKLTQYKECKGLSEAVCYAKVESLMDTFLLDRSFLWPTFAGNGFTYKEG